MRGGFSGRTREEWKRIVGAVEISVPLYESISERISLNLAASLRRRAVFFLSRKRGGWVLDSGSGPGVSTRLLIEYGFGRVVALDPSVKLLKFAKSKLGSGFEPVVGTAECLPFRSHAFGAVLTCFSLRDVRDLARSLQEFAVAGNPGCLLAVVDVGKPDSALARALVGLYVRRVMPVLARLLIRNRLEGNPFRMIVPTFNQLVTNHTLASMVEEKFGSAKLAESMLGGLILVEAVKTHGTTGLPETSPTPSSQANRV